MSDDDDDSTCPLCVEEIDESDKNFLPCPCGYRVCMWCWDHIRKNLNGLCPACRTPYNADPHAFSAVDRQEIVKKNRERKQKEKLDKRSTEKAHAASISSSAVKQPTTSALIDRRHLHNYRVVQRNLVYAIGVPASYANDELMRKADYFGQYGKIGKVVIHRNHGSGAAHSTVSVYVTMVHKEDARAAIQALDGFWMDGHIIRASFGTTKYCNNFIRGMPCNNPDCVYLHDLGEDEDRFTKEEIQAGLSKLVQPPGKDQSIVTGNGGPSGTGKRPNGEPVLPAPVFVQDNIPGKPSGVSRSSTWTAVPPPSQGNDSAFAASLPGGVGGNAPRTAAAAVLSGSRHSSNSNLMDAASSSSSSSAAQKTSSSDLTSSAGSDSFSTSGVQSTSRGGVQRGNTNTTGSGSVVIPPLPHLRRAVTSPADEPNSFSSASSSSNASSTSGGLSIVSTGTAGRAQRSNSGASTASGASANANAASRSSTPNSTSAAASAASAAHQSTGKVSKGDAAVGKKGALQSNNDSSSCSSAKSNSFVDSSIISVHKNGVNNVGIAAAELASSPEGGMAVASRVVGSTRRLPSSAQKAAVITSEAPISAAPSLPASAVSASGASPTTAKASSAPPASADSKEIAPKASIIGATGVIGVVGSPPPQQQEQQEKAVRSSVNTEESISNRVALSDSAKNSVSSSEGSGDQTDAKPIALSSPIVAVGMNVGLFPTSAAVLPSQASHATEAIGGTAGEAYSTTASSATGAASTSATSKTATSRAAAAGALHHLYTNALSNGLSNSAVFPVPVSSLQISVWAAIVQVPAATPEAPADLRCNPYGHLFLPLSELLDLTMPPVDAMGLKPWPKPQAYYKQESRPSVSPLAPYSYSSGMFHTSPSKQPLAPVPSLFPTSSITLPAPSLAYDSQLPLQNQKQNQSSINNNINNNSSNNNRANSAVFAGNARWGGPNSSGTPTAASTRLPLNGAGSIAGIRSSGFSASPSNPSAPAPAASIAASSSTNNTASTASRNFTALKQLLPGVNVNFGSLPASSSAAATTAAAATVSR